MTEAQCGEVNVRKFLAGNPSKDEILKYWSSACVDEDMGQGREYSRAVKNILRPLVKSMD